MAGWKYMICTVCDFHGFINTLITDLHTKNPFEAYAHTNILIMQYPYNMKVKNTTDFKKNGKMKSCVLLMD